MRFARIEHNDNPTFGIVSGEAGAEEIALITGDLFDGWDRSHNPAADPARLTGERLALADATLLVPVVPTTFYAAGLNYTDHVLEHARVNGREPNIPAKPDIGYRANNALIAHGQSIVKPSDSTEVFQYEGEIVAVIGKRIKHVSEAEALDCVFGYTIGNDVSERTWQNQDRTFWRSKNTDTFKPMGPWIETGIVTGADLDALETTVRLNGREVIRFPTNNMLFGIALYISTMSRYLTLQPGDVIWMGTEGHAENMVPGDVCEIEIDGIGMLRNAVVAE